MTWLDWTVWGFVILSCCSLPGFCVIHRNRIHAVHRSSLHFPEPPLLCSELLFARRPVNGIPDPARAWCTDCGWPGSQGHSKDCPQLTGDRCPNCGNPKRTKHACHTCGFYGFMIEFPAVQLIPKTTTAFKKEGSK